MKIQTVKFFHSIKIGSTEKLFIDVREDKQFEIIRSGVDIIISDGKNTTYVNYNNAIWFTLVA